MAIASEVIDSMRAKFEALLPQLDERAQRLTLGAEARSLGHGGIVAVARASGSSRSRVQAGVADLERGQDLAGRVRRPGAGRKSVVPTDPGVVEALLSLVEPTRRGDPESALCWTTLSLKHLVDELTVLGYRVSTWSGGEPVARTGLQPAGELQDDRGASAP